MIRHLGVLMTVAGACIGLARTSAWAVDQRIHARLPTVADSTSSDSVYTLPAIVVNAKRIEPRDLFREIPGHVTFVEIEPFQTGIYKVSEVLDQLPGLHVRNYGAFGNYSTVSIRGSGSSQVTVYLDGVPLTRAGTGVTNLAELPFAGLDHIEVYRGFAPGSLPSASMGGAINLVTAAPDLRRMANRTRRQTSVVAATGSFGTRRWGLSQHLASGAWNGWIVADFMQSAGDFRFHDDNGTPLNPLDDEESLRRNNWTRNEEVLVKLGGPVLRQGRLALFNQWVQHRQGVAGISSFQSDHARLGTAYNLTRVELQLPPLLGGRLRAVTRAFHDWRRDTFVDPQSEIGLGYQDNRDVTQTLGLHLQTQWFLPGVQRLSGFLEARRENFSPWRRLPHEQLGPEQQRTCIEVSLENRLTFLRKRLALQSTLRATRENDEFQGDLRTLYSQRPARADTREYLEPRLGMRILLMPGIHATSSYGRYHRTPGFQELFGDGGSLAGSSDLIAEEGTNRDFGLELDHSLGGVRVRSEIVHFRNRVDHLVVLLPQSQRTFVARNIGSARMWGEEFLWRIVPRGENPLWKFEGGYTRQRTEDLGVDISWYAGKSLPGRPRDKLFSRLSLRWTRFELAYQYEHLGQNYLDRWNRDQVERRDLHGMDVAVESRGLSLRLGLRNLTDNQALDVAGFPVPGRTLSLSSDYRF